MRGLADGSALVRVWPTPSAARRNRKRVGFVLTLVAVLGLALVLARPVLGVTRTWTGLGPTNNWNDALNWSGNVVPGAADVATFDATSSKNATMNVAVNVARPVDRRRLRRHDHPGAGIAADRRRDRLDPGRRDLHRRHRGDHGERAVRDLRRSFTRDDGDALGLGQLHRHAAATSIPTAGPCPSAVAAATLDVTTADTFNNLPSRPERRPSPPARP